MHAWLLLFEQLNLLWDVLQVTTYNYMTDEVGGKRAYFILARKKKKEKEKRQKACYKCWYSLLDLASSNGKTMQL